PARRRSASTPPGENQNTKRKSVATRPSNTAAKVSLMRASEIVDASLGQRQGEVGAEGLRRGECADGSLLEQLLHRVDRRRRRETVSLARLEHRRGSLASLVAGLGPDMRSQVLRVGVHW